MARIVLDELMKKQPEVIVHVGDVYYSGTKKEARKNFLDLLNAARASRPIPVYNLPGNHDYYSGGEGFYDVLAELNSESGAPAQQASYFCLRNDHRQLQGMDTGYNDHDPFKVGADTSQLRDSEAAWQLDKIASAGK